MSNSKNLVFRILIPILCILAIGSFFLPCLTLAPSNYNQTSDATATINRFNVMVQKVNTENAIVPAVEDASADAGAKDTSQVNQEQFDQYIRQTLNYYQKLLNSTADNSWSILEMIDLVNTNPNYQFENGESSEINAQIVNELQQYTRLDITKLGNACYVIGSENNKVSGQEKLDTAEMLRAAEMVVLAQSGLETVALELIIVIVAGVLLLTTLVLSIFSTNKVTSIITFCTSLLGAGAAVAIVILLSTGQMSSMNAYMFIQDSNPITSLLSNISPMTTTAAVPVFTVGINLMFIAVPVLAIAAFILSGVNMILQLKTPASELEDIPDIPIEPIDVPTVMTKVPTLKCLRGSCEGLEIQLIPGETIYIGRDSSVSNVILDSSKISRKHCSIMYDPVRSEYVIMDLSSNGTFMENGEKLVKGFANRLAPGTTIYLYNRDYVFKLGDM